MKKVKSYLSFLLFFTLINKANSKDFDRGKKLFAQHCAVCHIAGGNIIIPEKNLRNSTLKSNGMYSFEAIKYEIINGKNTMPGFGGRLNSEEINEITEYILETNWKYY